MVGSGEFSDQHKLAYPDIRISQRSELIFQFIQEHRFTFSFTKMCQILDVSRSGYDAWRLRPPSIQTQVWARRV
ncbi:MAG: hypothetical protein C7B46_14445 [Sulfobacillus benefaciens]|uniref:Uncharacterized protein n=1 Tax=Sulfobacillus benefaciens TaxID=453960 RepID=A0A2T2XD38_9FIRM|nr:MAG: hypothetical protein C7B46_14445 [Sulfobacillus benefaciens]